MENNYDYCDELRKEYKIEELYSSTLYYRLNGFVTACKMDLSNSLFTKEISQMFLPYIHKDSNEEGLDYYINFTRSIDENGKYFMMIGKYNDLSLSFKNYYDKDRNKYKINELPFMITLGKEYDDNKYFILIESDNGSKIKFNIKKRMENDKVLDELSFYTCIKDFDSEIKFETILLIVNFFVNDPELLFDTCNALKKEKKGLFTSEIVRFGNKDIDILLKDNQKACEIVKKYVKVINTNK